MEELKCIEKRVILFFFYLHLYGGFANVFQSASHRNSLLGIISRGHPDDRGGVGLNLLQYLAFFSDNKAMKILGNRNLLGSLARGSTM